MLKFIDRWLEKFFMRKLHKKRKKLINDALYNFKISHPDITQEQLNDLERLIELESDRVYEIVDKSVLRAGIKRAKWTFWIMAVVTTILAGVIIAATHGTALPLLIPVASSIITWLVTIATLQINYNERIIGGINAVVNAYEKTYKMDVEDKLLLNEEKLNELSNQISELTTKFYELVDHTDDIKTMKAKLDEYLNTTQDPQIKNTKSNMNQVLFQTAEKSTTRNILIDLNEKVERLSIKVDTIYNTLETKGLLPASPTKNERLLARRPSFFTVEATSRPSPRKRGKSISPSPACE